MIGLNGKAFKALREHLDHLAEPWFLSFLVKHG